MEKRLRLLTVIIGLLLYLSPANAEVVTYPLPSCYISSGYWGVKVNGTTIPVAKYAPLGPVQYYFAHVSASGTNSYEIDAFETVNTYTVSPTSYGIPATKNGTKLTFSVGQSRYLQVKINSRTILYLLIDPIEESIPKTTDAGVYDVTDAPYNADNTGVTDVTAKLQQAIDYASAGGGGTVYFPEGVYLTGALNMKNNVKVYIKGGAALMAINDQTKYGTNPNPAHVINANAVNNIKIYGRGSIYSRGVLLNNFVRTDANGTFRNGPIQLVNSNNAVIEGITCVESTAWTLTFDRNTRNTAVKNIKILNEMTWAWNDGINMIGSHDITVQHCFVSTADDVACVKTQNFPKVDPGTPAYNITYDDIVCKSGISSGFKIGLQAEDDIYNVWAKNFEVLDCERGFNIDHWNGNGYWHDIHFVDWNIEEMTGTGSSIAKGKYVDVPFRIEIAQVASSTYEVGVGKVKDIEITRVKFNAFGANDSYFWGQDASNNVDGVKITDLYFGNTLILNNAAGHVQQKTFVSNVTYNASPTVSFAKPTPAVDTVLNMGSSISIVANASDINGTVAKIELYLNDVLIDTKTTAPYVWNENKQDAKLSNLATGSYKVKVVAFDNENATSEVVRVFTVNSITTGIFDFKANSNKNETFTIYPNPVSGSSFNVETIDKFASEISIFNTTGSRLFNKTIEKRDARSVTTITTPEKKGIYIIQVTDSNGKRSSKKLIVK